MIRVPVFLSFFIFLNHFLYSQQTDLPCGDLFYDSFEYNLDQWQHVGSECQKTKDFSSSGMYGLRLKDNSQLGSSISTIPLDLSDYRTVSFNFQYTCKGFEDFENFVLEASIDGGETYSLQENWVKGLDFENGETVNESLNISLHFSSNTIFRIRCDASSNDDQLFIDEVQISNCPFQGGLAFSSSKNHTANIVTVSTKRKAGALMLESIPGLEKFKIHMNLLQGKSGSVEIFNKMGAKLSRSVFNYDHSGELTFPIDYLEKGNYSVCVKSSDDKLYVLRLVVGS